MAKILIVEDDVTLRNELEIFLQKHGYEVVTIWQFDTAIEDMTKAKCDLILLDINLPKLNGEYILKEVRKQSQVPIIMVTSRDNEMDELISMNYGADESMINKALVKQIGIFFLVPLALAIIHSIFGIQFLLTILSVQVKPEELLPSIISTVIFFGIIYGAYFIATYSGSKNMIRGE